MSEGRGSREGGGSERCSVRAGEDLVLGAAPTDAGFTRIRFAHCRGMKGMDRAARELSTAASAERNLLCCRSECGMACAEGQ